MTKNNSLKELAKTFLRLGSTAFGGPAAHIAMMEEVVVRKHQWMSKEEFLDLLGATNLIPGPNSTELAIHVGYRVGKWRGLLVAGTAFILPAFLIVWGLAWFYVEYGELPHFKSVFDGVKPVILAIIGQAIFNLSKTAIKDLVLLILGIVACALFLSDINEVLILFVIAFLNLLVRSINPKKAKSIFIFFISLNLAFIHRAAAFVNERSQVPIENLFLFFVKVGAVLFGSGYVLIAFLQSDLVDKYQWITQQQLIDAIAVGQFTPGPVFTTATFIGYLVAGNQGAILSTIGIFAPAFIFVALTAPVLPKLRKARWTSLILDGLNVASLSLMAAACYMLAKGTVTSLYGILVLVVSLILLIRFKLNSVWLILATALLGYLGLAT